MSKIDDFRSRSRQTARKLNEPIEAAKKSFEAFKESTKGKEEIEDMIANLMDDAADEEVVHDTEGVRL